jgi:hypothetical protein
MYLCVGGALCAGAHQPVPSQPEEPVVVTALECGERGLWTGETELPPHCTQVATDPLHSFC